MQDLTKNIRAFNEERDWNQFHYPKDLSMALSIEAGELMELFLWDSQEVSLKPDYDKMVKIKEEVGDVVIYLAALCDRLNIDPIDCAFKKLEINTAKYPVEKAKGNSKKYTEL